MVEYVKVSKSGRSLVISIPPSIRDALKLAWKDQLCLVVAGDQLLINRIRPEDDPRRYVPHRAQK
jgi:antitoxin component of MazEF toxin-antitoxin module